MDIKPVPGVGNSWDLGGHDRFIPLLESTSITFHRPSLQQEAVRRLARLREKH